MLPLKLSLEGIYSYQETQTIDFQTLTDAGLFGIFGKVGSGKSTILEAISFALYGETERLNKGDKRGYNMLNLKSKKAKIVFEFQNFEQEQFQFCAEWKRRKNFQETNQVSRTAYKKINGEWFPLESNSAEKVIGLNYNNFRRTIIIPQGKFQEFLQLGGTDRSTMMKEIFNLQRFDLQRNVHHLAKKNQSEIDELTGKLSTYLDISPDFLKEKQEEQQRSLESYKTVKAAHERIEKEVLQLKEVKDKFLLLKKRKEELELLHAQKESMDALEKKLHLFEKTSLHFSSLLKNQESLKKKQLALVAEIQKLEKDLQILSSSLKENEQSLSAIQPEYEQLDQLKNKAKDYDFLIQIVEAEKEKELRNTRIQKGNEELEKKKKEELNYAEIIAQADKDLEIKKAQKINTEELLEVEKWFSTWEFHLQKRIKSEKASLDIDQRLKKNTNDFSLLQLSAEKWEEEIAEQRKQWEKEQEHIQKEAAQYAIKQELSRFAHSLEDGQPCMLCGSLEHPDIMEAHDVAEKINELQQRQLTIQKQLKSIEELHFSAQGLVQEQQQILKSKEDFRSELLAIQEEEKMLKDQFIWPHYEMGNKDLFTQKKQASQKVEQEISRIETSIKENRKLLEKAKADYLLYSESIQKFKNEAIAFTAQIEQNKKNLHLLNPMDFQEKSLDDLQSEQKELKSHIENISTDYQQLSQKIQDLKNKISGQDGSLIATKKGEVQLSEDLQQQTLEINETLKQQGLSGVEEVQEILSWNINTELEKKKLSAYQNELFNAKENFSQAQKELEGKSFDEEIFQQKSIELTALKIQLEELIGRQAALKSEIEIIEKKIKIKVELESNLNKLNLRAENLKTMSSLFMANGFVNYVSGIYLQHLCNSANVRFRKLSKNQLELCLNEKNEFEVRDYLHEGHCRSVKTLSGGQTFQASLSLALALAESVQSLNQSGKNFFFIDEGFGTQDKEMIQVVFDTLQALHKENRIVGIISHVEELQEQIPISLTITNDAERGSLIGV